MKLSHQATILFWGRLSSQIALVVRAMLFSRMMPPEVYGSYGQAMTVGLLVTPLLTMGLERAVPFFFSRLSEEKQKGLSVVLSTYLSLAGIVTAAALFFWSGAIASAWQSPQVGPVLRVYAVVVAFMQLPVVVPPALLTKRFPITSGLYLPLMEVPGVVVAVTTYYLTSSVQVMFLVLAGMRAVHCLVGIYLMVHVPFREVRAAFDRSLAGDVIKYALPLGAAIIVGQISRTIDKLFIGYYFDEAKFAIYRNGAFELPVFLLVTASIFTVLLPEMARLVNEGKGQAAARLWKEGVRRCAILILPAIVFTFVFAEDLIVFLFGDYYLPSVPVFRIYTAGLLVRVAQYGTLLVAFGRPRLILLLSIFSLLLSTTGCVVFIPLFGFKGPAVAALVTRYVRSLATLVVVSGVAGVSFSRVLPWGPLGRLLGCSVIACLAACPVLWLDTWPLLRLFAGWAVVVPVFAVAGFYSGTISKADADFVLMPLANRWRAWRSRGDGHF